MSIQTMTAFLTDLEKDKALNERFESVIATSGTEDDAVRAVADLAREKGYEVTPEQVGAFRRQMLAASESGVIPEEILQEVSGGDKGRTASGGDGTGVPHLLLGGSGGGGSPQPGRLPLPTDLFGAFSFKGW